MPGASSQPSAGRAASAAVVMAPVDQARAEGKQITLCWAAWDPANALVELSKDFTAKTGIDWARIDAFHMDEYLGLPAGAPQLFSSYLRTHLFSRVPFHRVFLIDGQAPDAERECTRYAALLGEAAIDVLRGIARVAIGTAVGVAGRAGHRRRPDRIDARHLFSPSRLNIDVEYRFYAGLPWFHKTGRMTAVKDFEAEAMRDDEWVFSGHSFTDSVWMGADGKLRTGEVDKEHQDNLWGVGFFNKESKDSFIALFLEHKAEGLPELKHSGAPTLSYRCHGQLWSRFALVGQHVPAGAVLHEKNAYVTLPFTTAEPCLTR